MKPDDDSNHLARVGHEKRSSQMSRSYAIFTSYSALNYSQRHCERVGEVEYIIILAKVQNLFCFIVFCD